MIKRLLFCVLILCTLNVCSINAQVLFDKEDVGIDVSSYQGLINWEKVSANGIKFAFIRCKSAVSGEDTFFDYNAEKANEVGIPIGVYYYSGATSDLEAYAETIYTIASAKKHNVQLPLVYDIEGAMSSVEPNRLLQNISIFCYEVEKAGYVPMIYSNSNFFKNYIPNQTFKTWVACYRDEIPYLPDNVEYWQYTSKGSVDGIIGNVDMNYRAAINKTLVTYE